MSDEFESEGFLRNLGNGEACGANVKASLVERLAVDADRLQFQLLAVEHQSVRSSRLMPRWASAASAQ